MSRPKKPAKTAITDDEAWFTKFFIGSIAAVVLSTMLLPFLSNIKLSPASTNPRVASIDTSLVK